MKILYVLVLFNFLSFNSLIYTQIGVFTETPKTLFHIDGDGDNIITNDWIFTESGGHSKIALGKLPDTDTGAQLELGSTQSAFLPNRVALTSISDNITVPLPVEGMIVYNTAITTGSNKVIPGLYYHDGIKWCYLYNLSSLNMSLTYRDLQTSAVTTGGNALQPENTTLMDFGGPIEISETGGYNFSFRMYGRTSNTTNEVFVGIYYLWCMTYDSATNVYTTKDVIELDLPVYSTGVPITTTATLGASFTAGDKVFFRISHNPNFAAAVNYIWTLLANPGLNANKTSVIYWKNYF
ncbi:hypothetical protein [Dysgonomonas sp. GY617]|uniref:hypothetical protein n=1 Tax=Dysgonomonas sp. GY617 TaxID=2780420 RepID=UPI0018842161|nr:hypothetical protein [Dysgonomonas sp. GY617]MBF0577144.1 hypothetical protein [Dysgonomonas sp. GY617]